MKTYKGKVLTEDYLDDLVDEWHTGAYTQFPSFEKFIVQHTGFTHDEFVLWVANGRIPK